ncbi:UV-B-induced protein At3g17800, chloroplastic-like [Andrographis paniculata]|uniref:UV-B-induced protein At3g17800, chloroplastic-like n=1 Tax=Andrographis paniculata TaxID=175694 RepID=UPI0021E95519|nr:UV-B-induced protein At3g17800, chloroplastic-like [Andrographis paniculata]
MESATAFRASQISISPNWTVRSLPQLEFGSGYLLANAGVQKMQSSSSMKFGSQKAYPLCKRDSDIKASMPRDSGAPIAPLQLESPVGQFLWEMLVSDPHLVPAAVDQQLQQMQTYRHADQKKGPSASPAELVLYRRIGQLRAKERKQALEEILYALVVLKFMDENVPLIPAIASSLEANNNSRVDVWPNEDDKLERLHSPEVRDMIHNHLTLLLGYRYDASASKVVDISKLRIGQAYYASVMYGYFLKRVDRRYQLEKGMNNKLQERLTEKRRSSSSSRKAMSNNGPGIPASSLWAGSGCFAGTTRCKLSRYVMSFDAETVQGYASIRSEEAIDIVEKHREALFGIPADGNCFVDGSIQISLGGVKRLVLEALTFGSFLRDVESYVDSRCHLLTNWIDWLID